MEVEIMSYEVDFDSQLDCERALTEYYQVFKDENGNLLKGIITSDNEFDVSDNGYVQGLTADNTYYYTYGIMSGNLPGAAYKYSLTMGLYRSPFFIEDNRIRPYFTWSNTSDFFNFHAAISDPTRYDNWVYPSNVYGNYNNNHKDVLVENSVSAFIKLEQSDEPKDILQPTINSGGAKKIFSNSYVYIGSTQQRSLDTTLNNVGQNMNVKDIFFNENLYPGFFDTNIPVFKESNIDGILNWVNNGDRSDEEHRPTPYTTAFKLWVKGLDSPSYKLNWHNDTLETQEYDFSNATVIIKVGKKRSDGVFYHTLLEVPYRDGSVKFTFYDMEEVAGDVTILDTYLALECYVEYSADNSSGAPSVFLNKKANTFELMYKDISIGNDGSTISVINYEDDPSGYDDDDDDYHDPDDNSDDTPDPSIDIDVSNELAKCYVIEAIELHKLSQFLWGADFFDNIKLINNSPIENIVSLKAIIGGVTGGDSQTLTLGNVETTSTVKPCSEVLSIDAGSITLPRKYNNFLDFEPYTKVQLYLPFYGTTMVDSSLVIGRTINIKYIIDVITGTAKIKIFHDAKTLYEFKCNVGCDLPITSSNRANVEMGYISSGLGMLGSVASGNMIGASMSLLNMAQSQFHSQTTGNCNGVLNFHDTREVTAIVDRPVYTELRNFNAIHGRMCNLSLTLGNLSGFTKCSENVRLNFKLLKQEEELLRELLSNGVVI